MVGKKRLASLAALLIAVGGVSAGIAAIVNASRTATGTIGRLIGRTAATENRSHIVIRSLLPDRPLAAGLRLSTGVEPEAERGAWRRELRIVPGDVVKWMVWVQGTREQVVNRVSARVVLAPHLKVIPGSVRMMVGDHTESALADAPLFGGGFELGNFGSGSGAVVIFDTKALDDFAGCSVRVRNYAMVRAPTVAELRGPRPFNSADAIITKTHC